MASPDGGPVPQRVVTSGRGWTPLLVLAVAVAIAGTGLLGRLISMAPPTPVTSATPAGLVATSADPTPVAITAGPTSAPYLAVGPVNPSEAPGSSPSITPARFASWTATESMSRPRFGHTATLLPDGKVLVAGGLFWDHGIASAELYDPITRTWAATGYMVAGRAFATATLLWDGKVLVAGGTDPGQPSAELYDPDSGTWAATGYMGPLRSLATATLLEDGRVLVAGGAENTGPPTNNGNLAIVASAELYDPDTGTWTATASMATSRYAHTATLLPDGRVLVAGGIDRNPAAAGGGTVDIVASAELYDPYTGAWTPTGAMATAREGHAATLLADGKVLVAGEAGTGELSAELYDPGSQSWTATGSPVAGHVNAAALLRDGTVLVALGGRATDLYDPGTGSWTATVTGSADTGTGTTATLLGDGTVLLAGGETRHGDVASSELYHPGNTLVRPLPAAGVLAPGTYSLANPCPSNCSDWIQIIFKLPAGWATSDGFVYKHLDQPNEVMLSAWSVDQVYVNPCHWQGSRLSELDLTAPNRALGALRAPGLESAGLANQLVRSASSLDPVELGGTYALRIRLAVPTELDLSTCDEGQYRSWTARYVAAGANAHGAPGQIDVVYEVDVDRQPLVIDASHMPRASQADLAELEGILASMIIDRGA